MMSNIFVVGPVISQHIQSWYQCWNSNFKLHVFTIHPGGRLFNENVIVHTFNVTNTRFDFILFIPYLMYYWFKLNPVLTNFHFLSSYGLLALLFPKRSLVLNTWGSDVNIPYEKGKGLKCWLIKKALKRFVWINAPAQHIKDKLVLLGANKSAIDVFQYGIDVGSYEVATSKCSDKIIFISNRNWQKLYNIDWIIREFISWRKKTNYNAQLWIYGCGDTDDQQRVLDAADSEADKSVEDSIIFKGYKQREHMLSEMAQANIYISVPQRDGTPLSLLEAMAIGLYPIVSKIDANYEWLSEQNATFVTPTVSNELADVFDNAIKKYSSDTWKKENYQRVENLANISVNVPRFHMKLHSFINN